MEEEVYLINCPNCGHAYVVDKFVGEVECHLCRWHYDQEKGKKQTMPRFAYTAHKHRFGG